MHAIDVSRGNVFDETLSDSISGRVGRSAGQDVGVAGVAGVLPNLRYRVN